jgi:hypothetical protein
MMRQNGNIKGTDTFHLDDGYYVYVNWTCRLHPRSSHLNGPKECHVWIGESWVNPIIIEGIRMRAYTCYYEEKMEFAVLRAKSFFCQFIFSYREKLKDIIQYEQYNI